MVFNFWSTTPAKAISKAAGAIADAHGSVVTDMHLNGAAALLHVGGAVGDYTVTASVRFEYLNATSQTVWTPDTALVDAISRASAIDHGYMTDAHAYARLAVPAPDDGG